MKDIVVDIVPEKAIGFSKNQDKYGWMSNMYPTNIEHGGYTYYHCEGLFQSLRFEDEYIRGLIRKEKNPMKAKSVAKKYWKLINIEHLGQKDVTNMWLTIDLKFTQHPILLEKLLETSGYYIYENVSNRIGNKDSANLFWGAAIIKDKFFVGMNVLGQILMQHRDYFEGYKK